LDVTAIGRLAIEAASRPLRDAEVDAIARRADGSPLFAIELARAVSAGLLDDVPDSVERLISIRLDALDPDVRHLIRVAAVVGNRFDEAVIAPVSGLDSIGSALRDAEDADVILSTGPGAWQFQHALYRDVAYEGLPFSQRRSLHRSCGEVIESQADSPIGVASLLSLHFSKARDAKRAWEYSVVAGRAAAANYAYADAAAVLDRAMMAGRRLRSIPREERVAVAVDAAEANVVIGRFDRARETLEVARRLNDSTAIEADLMRRRGEIAEREGDIRSALSWYSRAEAKIPTATRDVDELVARAQVLLANAGLLYMRDELHESTRLSHAALADAEEAQHDPSRSQAFRRLHLAHIYLRTRYADMYGSQALVAFEELGDISSQMSVLNNFGIQRYLEEDWSAASDFYRQAAELAAKSGDAVHSGLASLNSGEVLSDQGHWQRALERYADARRNFEAVGYATGAAASRLFAGIALGRAGDLAEGRAELLHARAELDRLTVSVLVDDANVRLLEIDAVADPVAVIEQRSRIHTMAAESPELASRLRRAQGIAEVAHGEPAQGQFSLLESLAAAASGSHDRAMVLHALTKLFPDDAAQPSWERELSEISSRLGLAAFPALTMAAVGLSRA